AANLAFSVNQEHASANAGAASTSMTAGQSVTTGLLLNDPLQPAPFANQIKTGAFNLHVYNATGVATLTNIPVTAGTTTMTSLMTDLNKPNTGITASLDATNHLVIAPKTPNTGVTLSNDTSNVLAAYEVNNFFTGSKASNIGLASAITTSAAAINTGKTDTATSLITTGDNTTAVAIMQLQNLAMNFDGSASATSLNTRTSNVASQFGTDVANSILQAKYTTAESDTLNAQRQAISGVNMDEELVSMIKFQNAYSAASKIITTTNQMLGTLMGIIR
ncbi:MAG: flagellar basal body rod C-terminal domain-containing protein, partial [Mariprofundus sp.]|nr:flagellar basal body rod C-terminal domain-containing protein [Mariprofundus sp.]